MNKPYYPWKFVEFVVGPEGSRLTAQGGRTVPSHKATAESPAIANIRRLPISPDWPVVEDAANLAIEEGFFEGENELDDLLKRLDDETSGKF